MENTVTEPENTVAELEAARAKKRAYQHEWYLKNRASSAEKRKLNAERMRAYRLANPEKFKARDRERHKRRYATASGRRAVKSTKLKRGYGITIEEYESLLASQNGACAICLLPASSFTQMLCVDHDHRTNAIRGLLCHRCNRAIGLLQDNIEAMLRAVDYIGN